MAHPESTTVAETDEDNGAAAVAEPSAADAVGAGPETAPSTVDEPPIWSPATDVSSSLPERSRGRAVLAGTAALVLVAAAIAIALAVRSNGSPARSTAGRGADAPGRGSIATAPAGAATSMIAMVADGTMQVETHLILSTSTSTLTLTVADPATTRAAAEYRPQVTEIEVTAAGSPTIAVDDLGPGSSATIDLGDGGTAITLTYRVAGAVVHSQPSPPQRRAVLATPLAISAGQPIMSTISVPDATNFGCWAPHAASSVSCGEATRSGWQVALTPHRADAVVIAQVNLPR